PAFAVFVHWLSLPLLALWRSIVHLIAKRPAEVIPEWSAAVATMVSIPSVVRARARIKQHRTVGWHSVAPLRVSRAEQKQLLDDATDHPEAVSELGFLSGGGAWA